MTVEVRRFAEDDRRACQRIAAAAAFLDAELLFDDVTQHLDLGGGLGITYTDEAPPAAEVLVAALLSAPLMLPMLLAPFGVHAMLPGWWRQHRRTRALEAAVPRTGAHK